MQRFHIRAVNDQLSRSKMLKRLFLSRDSVRTVSPRRVCVNLRWFVCLIYLLLQYWQLFKIWTVWVVRVLSQSKSTATIFLHWTITEIITATVNAFEKSRSIPYICCLHAFELSMLFFIYHELKRGIADFRLRLKLDVYYITLSTRLIQNG